MIEKIVIYYGIQIKKRKECNTVYYLSYALLGRQTTCNANKRVYPFYNENYIQADVSMIIEYTIPLALFRSK